MSKVIRHDFLSGNYGGFLSTVSTLTVTALEQFLARLDADPAQSAEKYEVLRLKLVKCLAWRGCADSEADALADTALDRVALKLAAGEQIQNVNAYSLEVLRFVWLEHTRRRKEFATDDGEMPEQAVQPDVEILKDPDLRMRCLRKCLAETLPDERDRMLIVGYYDTEAGGKNKDARRTLAERLGLSTSTLKVKACRLRDRLERCINECVARLTVTKTPARATTLQGGDADD